MKLLLDTHALLWWLAGDARNLSKPAREAIGDADNSVYVSAASAWEIATRQRTGKLDAGVLSGQMTRVIAQQTFITLDISMDHAERAGALAGAQRDPFDRMLIAQAQAENLTLVSNESVFDGYGVSRLW
ncbi:MAG: type II toxin-antitoxin system VapC family toxin [Gemmatimonadaceae bacterium]